MLKRFAAAGTMKNKFNGFFEWNTFAFWAAAVIEVMVFFIF